MSALIIGEEAIAPLIELSETLKEKTKARAEELDKRSYEFYSPWMCIRPLLSEPIEDSGLLSYRYAGELVTDREHLSRIDRYLEGQGRPLMECLPVEPSEWPVMTDIAESRPDAVSAFHEGRALLRSSYFLESLYPALVECVIPQRRERPSGFDTALARGVVFRTFPKDRTGLALHAPGSQAAHAEFEAVQLSVLCRLDNNRQELSANH